MFKDIKNKLEWHRVECKPPPKPDRFNSNRFKSTRSRFPRLDLHQILFTWISFFKQPHYSVRNWQKCQNRVSAAASGNNSRCFWWDLMTCWAVIVTLDNFQPCLWRQNCQPELYNPWWLRLSRCCLRSQLLPFIVFKSTKPFTCKCLVMNSSFMSVCFPWSKAKCFYHKRVAPYLTCTPVSDPTMRRFVCRRLIQHSTYVQHLFF